MRFPVEDHASSSETGGAIFSVVIPTYNQADFLGDALRSVLKQTCQRFEIAVIDNSSTDHTAEVVESFRDPRISLHQVHNQGVIGISRNFGISETQAPFVAFLDSDDTWYPEKLQRVHETWTENPEVGIVCHDEYAVREGRVAYSLRYGPYHEDMYRFLLLNGCRLSTSATVVRRDFLVKVEGFSQDPNLAGVEDYDLWLRLSRVCRFHFLRQYLGEFRLHPQSHSSSSGVHLAHTLYLLDAHFRALEGEGSPLPRMLLRRERATRYAGAARNTTSWWGRNGALAYCGAALKETPLNWKTYARISRSLAARLLNMATSSSGENGAR